MGHRTGAVLGLMVAMGACGDDGADGSGAVPPSTAAPTPVTGTVGDPSSEGGEAPDDRVPEEAAPAAPAPNTLHLVTVSVAPLADRERRMLAAMADSFARDHQVTRETMSAGDAEPWLAATGQLPETAPPAWRGKETVILMKVRSNRANDAALEALTVLRFPDRVALLRYEGHDYIGPVTTGDRVPPAWLWHKQQLELLLQASSSSAPAEHGEAGQ